jgi:hypothetical protein
MDVVRCHQGLSSASEGYIKDTITYTIAEKRSHKRGQQDRWPGTKANGCAEKRTRRSGIASLTEPEREIAYPAGRGVASIGDPVVESVRGPRNYSERGVATPAVLRMRCPSIARSTRGKNSCITSSPANDADLTTRPCATPSLRAESGQDCRGSRRIRRLLPCATPTAHGATPPIVGDGHSL